MSAPVDAGVAPLLALESIRYEMSGRTILDDLSLAFAPGRCTAIVGPNGAGKSVLLRIGHGLLRPTAGRVTWARGATPVRHAMVFQRPVLLRRSAIANVRYALAVAGLSRAERAARAREALAAVGLTDVAERPARVLSGGEQQRLALARASALAPDLLFLDEPTANLDPGATHEIERVVAAMHRAGTTIVMVTHNLGQARRLADEIVFLHRGRVLEVAAADTFFRAPRSAEATQFLEGELPW
jgi:tungstate transport system ATP-binding protein